MLSLTVPKILFNVWFWMAIMAVVIAIHYVWGKPPPPPRKNAFFEKHKQSIIRMTDIFLITVILFGWAPLIYMSVPMALEPLLNPPRVPLPLTEELKYALAFFSTGAIYASGTSGVLFGFLRIFQSNLNKVKRLILLVISLLPIVFTALLIFTTPVKEPQYFWSVIKSGLGSFFGCLVVNGPAIVAGQHFIRVAWLLMRKLKLSSGEFPG
jgi:hypothetical protein